VQEVDSEGDVRIRRWNFDGGAELRKRIVEIRLLGSPGIVLEPVGVLATSPRTNS